MGVLFEETGVLFEETGVLFEETPKKGEFLTTLLF
jgi:hypothetical protein